MLMLTGPLLHRLAAKRKGKEKEKEIWGKKLRWELES